MSVRKKRLTSTQILYNFVRKELSCLDDGKWYSDSIIDYCLTKACEAAVSNEYSLVYQWNLDGVAGDDFTVMSSFLIARVLSCKKSASLPSGKGWILGGNCSMCEFLVVPINFAAHHWSLGIVWLAPTPGSSKWTRCILYLDSLSSSATDQQVEEKCGAIRTYLNILSQDVNTADSLPVIRVNVPQQDNGYDCGLFILHYAILFITCQDKRALAKDLIDGKKETWFGMTQDKVSSFVYDLRKSVRNAVHIAIANLEPPVTADESKTTVGWITSDGIVDLLSEEESDEKEGSISELQVKKTKQLKDKLRQDTKSGKVTRNKSAQ